MSPSPEWYEKAAAITAACPHDSAMPPRGCSGKTSGLFVPPEGEASVDAP